MPVETRAARLEPTAVATGRILLVIAALFAMMALGMGGVGVMYALKRNGAEHIEPQRFPEPRLETNIDPRATADSSHGPDATGRTPPLARAQETAPAPAALRAAMAAVVARGDQAFAPPPAAAPTPTPPPTPPLGVGK